MTDRQRPQLLPSLLAMQRRCHALPGREMTNGATKLVPFQRECRSTALAGFQGLQAPPRPAVKRWFEALHSRGACLVGKGRPTGTSLVKADQQHSPQHAPHLQTARDGKGEKRYVPSSSRWSTQVRSMHGRSRPEGMRFVFVDARPLAAECIGCPCFSRGYEA